MSIQIFLLCFLLLGSSLAAPKHRTAEESLDHIKQLLRQGNGKDIPPLDPFVIDDVEFNEPGGSLKVKFTLTGLTNFTVEPTLKDDTASGKIFYPELTLYYEVGEFKKLEVETNALVAPKSTTDDEDDDEITLEDLQKLGNIKLTMNNMTVEFRFDFTKDHKTVVDGEMSITTGSPHFELEGISREKGAGRFVYRFLDQGLQILFDALKEDLKYELDDEDKKAATKIFRGEGRDLLVARITKSIDKLKAMFDKDSSEENI